MGYEQMATVYDTFMNNAPYDKWLTLTEMLFKRNQSTIQSVLDIGCGTGQITNRLAESGYHMVGVDSSEEMLSYAETKAHDRNLSVQWIHQDVRYLEGLSSFDAVISYCDVMNYITTKEGLQLAFGNIYSALNNGGIFIFDVHAMGHIQHHLADRTFADVTEDAAYIWFCERGKKPGEVFHDLTFFIQNDRDTFERYSEGHHQRTYSVATYVQLLKEAGFENCKIYADFDLNGDFNEGEAERIFFLAHKRVTK
ncbi:MAG TPA: class I SAM-dependent methyltransferase [Bacillota bacterium]|nr:class I SAM-dependent methyltransferase [Bacillota bacterium]